MNTRVVFLITGVLIVGTIGISIYMQNQADSQLQKYQSAAAQAEIRLQQAKTAQEAKAQAEASKRAISETKPAEKTDSGAADIQACGAIGKLAKSIMERRQEGVSMNDMMQAGQNVDESIRTITKRIVIAAYELPRYSTQEVIDRTVSDFENEIYLECIKVRTKK
jgi:hypothetical protein